MPRNFGIGGGVTRTSFSARDAVVVTGDKELDRFFATLTDRLQRGAIRKGVRAGGAALIKEIRNNISTMVGKRSASRDRKRIRIDKRTGKKTSLKKAIGQRAWSKPRKGLIGTVVGARYPEGAHAHLVEFGHRIVTHAGVDTGKRTRPIPFQRRANRTAVPKVLKAQREKLQQAINKLRVKGMSRAA